MCCRNLVNFIRFGHYVFAIFFFIPLCHYITHLHTHTQLYDYIIYYITVLQIKDLDNVEFVEEETFAEASISWALDRVDQVSRVLDSIFQHEGDGEGVDIYILDTGKKAYFEHLLFNSTCIYMYVCMCICIYIYIYIYICMYIYI